MSALQLIRKIFQFKQLHRVSFKCILRKNIKKLELCRFVNVLLCMCMSAYVPVSVPVTVAFDANVYLHSEP